MVIRHQRLSDQMKPQKHAIPIAAGNSASKHFHHHGTTALIVLDSRLIKVDFATRSPMIAGNQERPRPRPVAVTTLQQARTFRDDPELWRGVFTWPGVCY